MNNQVTVTVTEIQNTELAHIEARIERIKRHAWIELSIEYERIREGRLYRKQWGTWENYCPDRWGVRSQTVDQQIARRRELDEMVEISTISKEQLPASMSHATALAKLDEPKQRAEVWSRVLTNANGQGITAKMVTAEVERFKASLNKNWITLDEWNDGQRWHGSPSNKTMNTVNENIEWAAWSWNPVTGCLHNCDYCYARDIANRFYPQEFQPSFIPERLTMPANTKQATPRWEGDTGYKNVFVCSMADLFGKWVPGEWIQSVIDTCAENPEWNFLFLTKFPIRMAEFSYPPNVWLGTSVDKQHAVKRAETAFQKIEASNFHGVTWLSCEPMLERLTFKDIYMFDWVIIGGASKSTKTPEYRPPFDDIVHLYEQAREVKCMVYMKTNLLGKRVREYPR